MTENVVNMFSNELENQSLNLKHYGNKWTQQKQGIFRKDK